MFHHTPRSEYCFEETALHRPPASELAFSYQSAWLARAPEPHWEQPSQLQGNPDKLNQCLEIGGWEGP